jgi:hypothetical protein
MPVDTENKARLVIAPRAGVRCMPKRKRGAEMAPKPTQERGIVAGWLRDEQTGKSKGFGFIEHDGRRIFCHKTVIKDGDALLPGTEGACRRTEKASPD